METVPDHARPFDRDRLRQARARAASGFAGHDFLFREVGERLADRLDDVLPTFPVAVDLGGRGDIARENLAGRGGIETLIQAAGDHALSGSGPTCVAEEEMLPFGSGTIDLVFSNLALHWVNDLPGALIQIRNALRPDGLLLASLFAIDTLSELKDALFETEVEMGTGVAPRISPFVDTRDAGALLQRAGFALPVVDAETITVTYEHPLRLLADLRGMGETNSLAARSRRPLRRDVLMAALDLYRRRHGDREGRVPATFRIVTMTAWAPDPASQQRPLRPGSAEGRLADALGTDEESLKRE